MTEKANTVAIAIDEIKAASDRLQELSAEAATIKASIAQYATEQMLPAVQQIIQE